MDIQYFIRKGPSYICIIDPFFGAQAELKILIILLNDFHAEKNCIKQVTIQCKLNYNLKNSMQSFQHISFNFITFGRCVEAFCAKQKVKTR